MNDSLIHCLWHSKDSLVCLVPYAYEPMWVYLFTVAMMLLSAVGLPIPEEATLVSVGLLAYMGTHPLKYPPPFVGAPHVEAEKAAIIAFLSVFIADFLVYG
ncbi:MAG: DedA family protein, partial [Bdellovibrionales bacterium]